jgi:tripartite-type tricarboxylate transporter receptor subunit TctC
VNDKDCALPRRQWLAQACGLGAGLALPGLSRAQAWPSKAIRFIVPFAPGGSSEIVARTVAAELGKSLGQSVYVENKPGGAGNVAMQEAARADDQHTLILGHIGTLAVNPYIFPKLSYDANKDFTPITLISKVPSLYVVHPDLPVKNMREFVAYAKSKPGQLNYGSAGNGGSAHLSAELLAQRAGAKMTHIPFKGNGPALTEVMAGRVSYMFYPMIGVASHVAEKRLRILGVTTEKRHPDFPGAPTMAEAGFPGFESYVGPVGFMAPAGTPAPTLQKLSTAIRAALTKPEVRDRLRGLGAVVVGSSPEEYREWLKGDAQRWSQLIAAAQIKGD